jgi:hypothetical protein
MNALFFRADDTATRPTILAYTPAGEYVGNVQRLPGASRGGWLASMFDPRRDKGGMLGTLTVGMYETSDDAKHALVFKACRP